MTERQLSLSLSLPPSWRDDDFLVCDVNVSAVNAIDAWRTWSDPTSILYGPAGCGKSHLAHRFRDRSNAAWVRHASLVELDPLSLIEAHWSAVVDDADAAAVAGLEEPLLHLINSVREAGGRLLLTGREPPAAWPVCLPDLRSRLLAAPAAAIGPPDDALLAALLVKLFRDHQTSVAPDVVGYLVARMERSFAAARRIATALDIASYQQRRTVTVALAREILSEDQR